MSSRENRVARLESQTRGTIPHAVIIIPLTYDEDQREAAITEMTGDLPEPFDIWAIDTNSNDTHSLQWFGLLDELFDKIAKNPRRICDPKETSSSKEAPDAA